MKKKILLASLIVMALMCIFAISVCAAEPDQNGEKAVLKDKTVCPIWDTDGDALIWYITGTDADGKNTYGYIKAEDERVTYTATNWQGSVNGFSVNQTSEVYLTVDGVKYDKTKIVVFNINDEDVGLNAGNESKKGYTVNCLENTFSYSTSIEYVYLKPDFLTFQAGVFTGCSNLQYLNFEDLTSLNNISSQVFSGCTSFFAGKTLDLSKTALMNVQTNVFAGTGFTQIILPSTVTTLSNSALERTALTSFHIPETITSFGTYVFVSCTNLETLTGFEELFARGVLTEIPNNTFYNCPKLKLPFTNNTLPEGITRVGTQAFSGCTSIETIVFPNTLTTIGKEAFINCTGIKKVVLGAAFTTWETYDGFKNCSGLKEVYIPLTMTSIAGNVFNSSASDCIFYYTGTKAQLDIVAQNTVSNNTAFLTGYNNAVDYKNFNPDTASGKIVVYNYSACDAFYKGVHGESETTYKFKGEEYTTDYCSYSGCTRCNQTVEKKVFGPLFINKGYAKSNDGTCFTYGIVINEENIALYKARTNEDFNYGFVIGAVPEEEHTQIIDKDANALYGNTIVANFADISFENFTIYNVKMVGINTEVQQNTPVYCCAFVIDGEEISYMGDEITKNAVSISSSKIEPTF